MNKIKTPEEFVFEWENKQQGDWGREEIMQFATDYNTYVQKEEEKWFDHKENNEIEDLMKGVEKYLMKGMIIALRMIAKKQGLTIPKHKRK